MTRPSPAPAARLMRIGVAILATVLAGGAAPAAAAPASAAARSAAVWQDVAGRPSAARSSAAPEIQPLRFRALMLDRDPLADVLAGAPMTRTTVARSAPLTISLPAPEGGMKRFAIAESPVMEPGLAARHPEIATYRGRGIDEPGATVALDLTPQGFHASVRGPDGSWYIDPYYHREQSVYASYRGVDLVDSPHEDFVERGPIRRSATLDGPDSANAPGDTVAVHTYRLALVSDPAYALYHGGPANVTAAKVTLINRVNQIYEDDLAIHLDLVADNDRLNFDTDAKMTGANGPCGASACYTAGQSSSCATGTLDRTNAVLNQLIGIGNYDIGHLGMGVNGGGIAYIGVVGGTLKGGGCTGVTRPVGDLFAVDYVAHEMGHQFAANHTFNGLGGSCGSGNIHTATAVEPGGGSTIMSYAGICGSDNLQPHSDPYFSQRTIDEINTYIASAPSRGGAITTPGNRSPVVSAPGPFTIPARTPFTLTGSGSDPDGNALTYMWEQNDAGGGSGLTSNPKSGGPLFRVFGTAAAVTEAGTILTPSPGENSAGSTPTRVFPDLVQIAADNTNASGNCLNVDCWSESLPTSSYANALHFRLTARDGAGGVSHADSTLTLARSAGPFRLTSQGGPFSADAGTRIQLNWDVNQTNAAPVNAANLRVTLSTDGGLTFPKVVLRSTPNDGTQSVLLPNADTTHARLRIEPIGNVFFDTSDADFTVIPGAPVATSSAPGDTTTAQYSDPIANPAIEATDENSAGSDLTATIAGLNGLTISPGAATAHGRTFTIGGTANVAPGTYPVEVTVDDHANPTGHEGVAAFDVVVSPENAAAAYTGDTLVIGAPGAGQAPVNLSASLSDSPDGTPGDITNATVAFKEGATTLCSVAVTAAGAASCGGVILTTGATHHINAVVGGRYAGSAAGDVEVRRTDPPPPPPPPPAPIAPPPPVVVLPPVVAPPVVLPPPVTPPPALSLSRLLTPSLASVGKRRKVSRSGRVAIRLRCRVSGTGAIPRTCHGTIKLTAKVKGRTRTIGSAKFNFSRRTAKTISVKLTALARRTIKRSTRARLTVRASNFPRPSKVSRKTVTIVPRKR